MPTGPKGQKRPRDPNQLGKMIVDLSVGEAEEAEIVDDGKDPAAQALGAKGGRKRAENMTPERRAEIARKAAAKRWSKSG